MTSFLSEASFGLWVSSLPASVRVSIPPCVNNFVFLDKYDSFKLGSQNLDQGIHVHDTLVKIPIVFLGVIDRDLQSQI